MISNSCPCGSLLLPKGSKFDFDGMSVKLVSDYSYIDLDLVHNAESFLSNGQHFVTTSEIISLNENINQIILNIPSGCKIVNTINIVVKSYLTKEILFVKTIGKYNEEIIILNGEIELHNCIENVPFNLYNDKLQIEIYSICDFFDEECCGETPTGLFLTNLVGTISIECCSTTTTLNPGDHGGNS